MAAIAPLKIVTTTSIVPMVAASADYVHPSLRPAGGATILVDKVHGSNAFGAREGHPFATITAALAVAVAGDLVLISPGTYDESIVIPANVGVRGAQINAVTIQRLLVAADTDLVIMGEGSRLEDVALLLTSAGHFNLRGVVFPGTTSATAKLRTATVTLDNSTAGALGTSNVFGVHSFGTGAPNTAQQALRAVSVVVNSAGLGNKLGIFLDTAVHTFRVRDTNVLVMNAGGAGTYVGVLTFFAGVVFEGRLMSIEAPTADIVPFVGKASILLGQVTLVNNTSFGLSFTPITQPILIIYGDPAAMAAGIRYMRVGSATSSATEIKIRLSRPVVLQGLAIRAVTGPGAARVDTYTVRKNGVNTTLTASLVAAATFVEDAVNAVTFAAGDDLSIQANTAAGSTTADMVLTLEQYR